MKFDCIFRKQPFHIPIQLTPNVESTVISVTTFWEGASPREIEEGIVADVAKHRGEHEQTDDITLVILRRS